MQKFFVRLLLFIFFALLTVFFYLVVTIEVIEYKSNFKLKSKTTAVIIGHSHSACALNDSLIQNFQNLSGIGEAYFYTYVKLKKVVEQNPNLDTVFICFTNNQLEKLADAWLAKKEYILEKAPSFFPYLNFNEHHTLLAVNTNDYLISMCIFLKQSVTFLKGSMLNQSPIFSGYEPSNDVLKKKAFLRDFRRTKSYSKQNLNDLKKMVAFCEQRKIKVYLIRFPIHKKLQEKYNEALFQKVLNSNFKHLPFIDCINFPIENSEFRDYGHLNSKGARKFSLWFKNYKIQLKQGESDPGF